jgi:regulator of RNase E activity RraA
MQDGDQTSFHGDMVVADDLGVVGTEARMGHVYAVNKNGEVS